MSEERSGKSLFERVFGERPRNFIPLSDKYGPVEPTPRYSVDERLVEDFNQSLRRRLEKGLPKPEPVVIFTRSSYNAPVRTDPYAARRN